MAIPPETTRLILRNFRPEDAADVFAFASDAETARMVGWTRHRTLADTAAALANWQRQDTRLALVLRETGRVIGFLVANGAGKKGSWPLASMPLTAARAMRGRRWRPC